MIGSAARRLFAIPWLRGRGVEANRFCVAPGAGRFLFVKPFDEPGEEPSVVLVRNWARECAPSE